MPQVIPFTISNSPECMVLMLFEGQEDGRHSGLPCVRGNQVYKAWDAAPLPPQVVKVPGQPWCRNARHTPPTGVVGLSI